MASSAIAGIADRVLTAFVAPTAMTGTSRDAFTSLFLPESLRDQTAQLSGNDLVSLLLGSRRSLLGLSSAAERLDVAHPLSLFHGAGVTSSNSAAVTADITSGISAGTKPETADYNITIGQLALAQSNVGTALTGADANGFTAGTNTVRFVQHGITTDVSFTVTGGQSNLSVLNAFASAVNASTSNVKANVRSDAIAGTSRLVLTSRLTGTTNAFTLSDVTGSAVSNAGVDTTTTSAQNAAYNINGEVFSTDSNDFYLGAYANLRINLTAASSSAVVVSVKPDVSRLVNAISTLTNAYNTAKSLFETYRDINPAVSAHLGTVADRLQHDLANIGITVNSSGSFDVDTDDLKAALTARYGTVQRVIGEPHGLAPDLRSIANTMLARPSAEVAPLPAFQAGYTPQLLAGSYATRLDGIRLTGLLVDALS